MSTMNPIAKACRENLKPKLENSVPNLITISEINESKNEQTSFQYSYEWYAIKVNKEVYQLFFNHNIDWIDADKIIALSLIKLSEIAESQNLDVKQKLILTFNDSVHTLLATNEFNTPKTTVEVVKEEAFITELE